MPPPKHSKYVTNISVTLTKVAACHSLMRFFIAASSLWAGTMYVFSNYEFIESSTVPVAQEAHCKNVWN